MAHIKIEHLLVLLLYCFPLAAAAGPGTAMNAGITRQPDVAMPREPIHSQAQLDVYVHRTPASRSPLAWLSASARSRFLDGLVFDEQGSRRMYLDDLRYELDRKQIYTLLHLFGIQDYALDMAARTSPRHAGPSTLEPGYDQLARAVGQAGDLVTIYHRRFAPMQTVGNRHAAEDRDVEFLFRGAVLAFRATHQSTYLTDMQEDFAELRARHLADRPHASDLRDALIVSAEPGKASALLRTYPTIARGMAPVMRTVGRVHAGQASLWVVSTSKGARELLRFPFYIRARAQVLVLASADCPFSRDAATAIEAEIPLRKIFRDSAQWVAADDEITTFDAIQAWNTTYPASRMGIIHDNAELPMVQRIDTPTFYFLDHGRVVDTVVGWPEGGNIEAIRRGLRAIGLQR